ncbi:MAG: tyrosine-protein phosphatase [Anaerolineaceae bacterium]|nr:tyrosine-protein phosphatase [Anaerolineaceae bacterium]
MPAVIILSPLLILILILAVLLFRQSRLKIPSGEGLFTIQRDEKVVVERNNENTLCLKWTEQNRPRNILMGYSQHPFKPSKTWEHIPEELNLIVNQVNYHQRPYFKIIDLNGKESIVAERVFQTQNIRNFRDIGGYMTKEGRQVAWGRIFRAGSLNKASESDLSFLETIGIKSVFDLRDDWEVKNQPEFLPPSINYRHFFITGRELINRSAALIFRQDIFRQFVESYKKAIVDSGAQNIGKIIQALGNLENLPVVLHCTAGKDRAGVTAALILMALGVPEETVISDYTLSNLFASQIIRDVQKRIKPVRWLGFKVEHYFPLIDAKPFVLRSTVKYLLEKYESVENYLLEHAGLEQEHLKNLRNNLLL